MRRHLLFYTMMPSLSKYTPESKYTLLLSQVFLTQLIFNRFSLDTHHKNNIGWEPKALLKWFSIIASRLIGACWRYTCQPVVQAVPVSLTKWCVLGIMREAALPSHTLQVVLLEQQAPALSRSDAAACCVADIGAKALQMPCFYMARFWRLRGRALNTRLRRSQWKA